MDCTVVKVVVRDRTDGAGDENVLPSPPPFTPAVARVPAFECAASGSEIAVSPLVDIVAAVDFAPGPWFS